MIRWSWRLLPALLAMGSFPSWTWSEDQVAESEEPLPVVISSEGEERLVDEVLSRLDSVVERLTRDSEESESPNPVMLTSEDQEDIRWVAPETPESRKAIDRALDALREAGKHAEAEALERETRAGFGPRIYTIQHREEGRPGREGGPRGDAHRGDGPRHPEGDRPHTGPGGPRGDGPRPPHAGPGRDGGPREEHRPEPHGERGPQGGPPPHLGRPGWDGGPHGDAPRGDGPRHPEGDRPHFGPGGQRGDAHRPPHAGPGREDGPRGMGPGSRGDGHRPPHMGPGPHGPEVMGQMMRQRMMMMGGMMRGPGMGGPGMSGMGGPPAKALELLESLRNEIHGLREELHALRESMHKHANPEKPKAEKPKEEKPKEEPNKQAVKAKTTETVWQWELQPVRAGALQSRQTSNPVTEIELEISLDGSTFTPIGKTQLRRSGTTWMIVPVTN